MGSLGPGPMTPAVRAIVYANVAMFVLTFAAPIFVISWLGLTPQDVVARGRVWELATYLFVHSPTSLFHILFNMLAVWMFGVELEQRWGTRAFTTYYFLTGVGAGACVLLVSLLPFGFARASYGATTIGASGAVYGLLLAWALAFPYRKILFMFVFPLPARVAVVIMGAIAFFAAAGSPGGPVADLAHLGGLIVGWFYLKGPRNLRLELKYRMSRWRMERARKKFNVHRGGGRGSGRDDRGNWVH